MKPLPRQEESFKIMHWRESLVVGYESFYKNEMPRGNPGAPFHLSIGVESKKISLPWLLASLILMG